jgi:hypothetical protein
MSALWSQAHFPDLVQNLLIRECCVSGKHSFAKSKEQAFYGFVFATACGPLLRNVHAVVIVSSYVTENFILASHTFGTGVIGTYQNYHRYTVARKSARSFK